MTVSTTIRKAGPFAGTGLVSSYPFAFKVFTDDDLLVIRTPTGGADVTLVLASDYTVTLNPDQDTVPGGSVVLSAPLAVGYTLSIGSQVDSLQGLSLTNNGGFFPKAIENALDKLDIQDQQQEETLSRAVRVPFGSGAIPDLPAPSAGSALVWNTLGTALENGTPGVAYDTLRSDLLGTGTGQGASQVGVQDAAGLFNASTVEAALAELARERVSLWRFMSEAKITQARAATTAAGAPDVTTEMQTAFDFCASGLGRKLTVPGGGYKCGMVTYTPNTAINANYTSGLMMEGEGMGKTIFFNTSTGGNPMIYINGTSSGFAKGQQLKNFTVTTDGSSTSQNGVRSKGAWYTTWENVRIILLPGTAVLIGDDTAVNPDTTANAANTFINCEFDQNWSAITNPVNNNAPTFIMVGGSMRNNRRGGFVGNSSHIHIRGTSIAFNGFLDTANATGGVTVREKTGTTFSAGYRSKDVIIEGIEFDTNYPTHIDARQCERLLVENCGFMFHDYPTAAEIIAIPTWPDAQIRIGGTTATERVMGATLRNNRVAMLNENAIAGGMAGHKWLRIYPYAQNVTVRENTYDITTGTGVMGTDCWLIYEDSKSGTSPNTNFPRFHCDYDAPICNAQTTWLTTLNAYNMPFRKVFPSALGNMHWAWSSWADDTAKSVTVPQAWQDSGIGANYGMLVITIAGATASSALVLYRAAGGPVCANLSAAAANMTFTTGVLAGTTGTDVRFNISAHTDGKIYMENRLGSAQNVVMSFLMMPGTPDQPTI